MTASFVANSIRRFFIHSVALAVVAAGMLVAAPAADAKKMMCHKRYQACQSRCAKAYKDYLPCINRTCDRQFDNCVADGGTPAENAFAWIWQAPAERHLRDSASLRAGDAD